MIYSRHLIKVIPMAVVATFLTMLPTTAFAASPPNIVSVVPISLPDTIAGQTIPTGYQVGDSVIYPSSGGYSILANPRILTRHGPPLQRKRMSVINKP